MTTNLETARYLRRLGALLELNGASRSRNRILREAAAAIEASEATIGAGDLGEDGIKLGEEPRTVLTEFYERGETSLFEAHKDAYPLGLIDVVQVPGIGAARARSLHDALGVNDLDTLIAVAEAGDLPKIKGIGAKSAVKILESARAFKDELEAIEQAASEEDAPPDAEVEVSEVVEVTSAEEDERARRIREDLRGAVDVEVEEPAEDPPQAPPSLRVVEVEEAPQDAYSHLWANLRCSACHKIGLEEIDGAAQCGNCGRRHALDNHVIDMLGMVGGKRSVAQRLMELEPFVNIYESIHRPMVTRLATSRTLEDAYALNIDLLDLDEGLKLLDVGCGPGNFTRRFADTMRGSDTSLAVGVDVSAAMLQHARRDQFRPGGEGLFFVRADAVHLPFDDACMDRVHCAGSLNLTNDLHNALREMVRVTRPGGTLVVSALERRGSLAESLPRPKGAFWLLALPVLPLLMSVATGAVIIDGTKDALLSSLGLRWLEKGELARSLEELGATVIAEEREGIQTTVKARRAP